MSSILYLFALGCVLAFAMLEFFNDRKAGVMWFVPIIIVMIGILLRRLRGLREKRMQ